MYCLLSEVGILYIGTVHTCRIVTNYMISGSYERVSYEVICLNGAVGGEDVFLGQGCCAGGIEARETGP